jgi:uncharacterized membrane protein YGL010W
MTDSQPSPANPISPPGRRRPLLKFLRRRLEGWRLRHQLPINFWLHMVGIPMALGGVVLFIISFFSDLQWYWGVAAFFLGYLLQYIGHRFEGNDVGEWAAIKRLIGLPYVGISPRWNPEDPSRL